MCQNCVLESLDASTQDTKLFITKFTFWGLWRLFLHGAHNNLQTSPFHHYVIVSYPGNTPVKSIFGFTRYKNEWEDRFSVVLLLKNEHNVVCVHVVAYHY